MNAKILVIDDEESICEIVRYNLKREGHEVDTAYSAEEALKMDLKKYDLFIVDIMMEAMSGFEFAKCLRSGEGTADVPIIFCSALNGEDDTVMGLNIGADDYVTKPFKMSELIARVNAVLRRAELARKAAAAAIAQQPTQADHLEEAITYQGLSLDLNSKECYVDGKFVSLTKTEFELLEFFLTHRNRIYSREEIIRRVWAGDVIVTTRTIDTNITRLRKKIGAYGNNIETRLGFGYGFKEKA